MIYGIVSDIHGNLEALEAVLSAMGNVDQLACLGDVVGYSANPNECCELVRGFNALAVVGNHDRAVVGRLDITWFNDWARAAIQWTAQNLKPENRVFLNSLVEVQTVEENFTIVHGSLRDPVEEYITEPEAVLATMRLMKTPICFIGHTHVAEVYALTASDKRIEHVALTKGGTMKLKLGAKYLINCGGVGQPRDGNPKASFGIYDSETQTVTVNRVEYDIDSTARKILAAGLPEILAQRLYHGR